MSRLRPIFLAVFLLTTILPTAPSAASNPFADPAFQKLWARTDSLVGQPSINRGYYWGPGPNSGPLQEDYQQGVNGKRLVQYFDKSRMEINNPNGDPNNKFYVTNGLLTVELVSGRMQVGDNTFQSRYPAYIPLASDTDDFTAPTYASFQNLLGQHGGVLGRHVTDTVNRVGYAYVDSSKASDPSDVTVYHEPTTDHNIPKVFWDFLNQRGTVIEGGKRTTAHLNDPWFYATGYPISEAYWAKVKIGGQANTDVLIQLYERRVLTYVPSAPAAYRVQMGNIGQHYYAWRYRGSGNPPLDPLTCKPQPSGAIGEIWHKWHELSDALGCPSNSPASDALVEEQDFERGKLVEITVQHTASVTRLDFFLYPDGRTRQASADDYIGNDLDTAKYLGQPNGTPASLAMGYYQEFSNGIALSANAPLDQVYAFYSATSTGNGLDQWQIYTASYSDPVHYFLDPSVCGNGLPSKGIGKIWSEHPLDQAALGCPFESELSANIVIQQFEHGVMIDTVQPNQQSLYKYALFVLYDDGTAQFFDDTYKDGDDPGGHETPPSSNLQAPRYGFGKVWREHSGVKDRLGWAKSAETASAGSYQQFDYGMIVLTGPPARKAYSIVDTQRQRGIVSVDKWRMYDDTYNP